jgi:nitrite reductase/ring-hydroxylating ferredoxin subunit|tara:strand:- start:10026 stop:10412 length:387 start_codon:yes stop_codon:yes gene_type:complete
MTENRYEPPEMRGKRRVICHISEIAETGKGLSIKKIIKGDPDRSLDLFLVTDGDEVQGYFNICPHQGTPLDLKPDVFLDVEKKYIQCSTHGAKFQKDDGLCISGPCVGSKLMKIPIHLDSDGSILLGE